MHFCQRRHHRQLDSNTFSKPQTRGLGEFGSGNCIAPPLCSIIIDSYSSHYALPTEILPPYWPGESEIGWSGKASYKDRLLNREANSGTYKRRCSVSDLMSTPSYSFQAKQLQTSFFFFFSLTFSSCISIYPNMGSSRQFSFVNISRPEEGRSRRVLTSVRRHVMADVGRSKRKRAKWKIVPLEIASRDTSPNGDAAHIETSESAPLARMPPSFQTHLIDTDAHACELITFSKSS